jgi:hypothetical protein
MRRPILAIVVLLIGASAAPTVAKAQAAADSNTAVQVTSASNPGAADDTRGWLYPVARLNQALPRWLQIGGEYRDRPEGQTGIGYGASKDFYLLDRLRVSMNIQPLEWLLFRGEVQDSRIFFNRHIPDANPYQDTWTLWEGYAQVGSSTEGWVDGLAGRQVLRFGDERVIGPSDWLNVGRTFNVARVDLHHPGYLVSMFASAVVPGDSAELHNALAGDNMYGVYGSFQNIVPKAAFEPYVLWRVAPANPALAEEVGLGHLNEVTIGLHWKGTVRGDVDYNSEFDGQTGSLGVYSIAAWAGYIEAGKTFRKAALAPHFFFEGNYASGTKNPAGREWNTFDQLYPSNHDKYGFADLAGRRNLEQFRAGVEEKPTKKWKLKQQFEGYWLATSYDNFYSSSGAIAVRAHPGANRHVGNELDLANEYLFDQGLRLGLGYGRLFAGQFLKTTTLGHDFGYPYAYLEYNFARSGVRAPVTASQRN